MIAALIGLGIAALAAWRLLARRASRRTEPCTHVPSWNVVRREPTVWERAKYRVADGHLVGCCEWCGQPLITLPREAAAA